MTTEITPEEKKRRSAVGRRSRNKGGRGEREFVQILKDHGWDARRSQQYCGKGGDEDVICEALPVHHEVKYRQSLNVHQAIAQAVKDCIKSKWRCVVWKKDRAGWVALLPLEDYLDIMKELTELKK